MLRGARHRARALDVHPRGVRRLHRHPEGQRLPLDPHRRDRPARRAASRCRSAPATCTSTPSSASPRTGPTRKAAHATRSTSARSSGCGACSSRQEGRAADADRDLIEGMRSELFEDRVYVLTPKGEVIDLPRGATPLDFAYSVHTSLGHRCRGAKVNGRIVPLTHTAQQRRDRRDHHRQAGRPEPRLAGARTGLSHLAAQPRQGARLVPQVRTQATTATPGRHRRARAGAHRCRAAAARARWRRS